MNNDVGNWLPISGNILPAVGNPVLISVILGNMQKVCGVGALNSANGWQIIYMPSDSVNMIAGVDAWCPLPSPYKGDIPDG